MLHFFDVIYYIKKTFTGVDDVENTNQKALAIENATDYKEQNKLITDLVLEAAGGPDVRVLRDMTVYIHPNRGNSAYKVVDFAVQSAYRAIESFDIDDSKLELYRIFLSNLKATNGASMNSKDKITNSLEDSDKLNDEGLQRFVRTFKALKENDAKDLYSIVHFIYENNLQHVAFRRMNRDLSQLNISVSGKPVKDLDERLLDGKKFTDVVPNECLIIVPILEEMKELKMINNELRKEFYRVFLEVDEYNDDDKFIDAIKKANKKFVNLNLDKIREIIKNIGQTDILKKRVSKRLEDVKTIKQDAQPTITDKFKKADIKLTPENLIFEYIAFPDESKVIDADDIENVEKMLDDCIVFILNLVVRELSEIERNINVYNALLREHLNIDSGNNSTVMPLLKEAIERWQAFIKTPLFSQEIMAGLLKQIKKNEGGRFNKLFEGFNSSSSSTTSDESGASEQTTNTFQYKILKENVCDNIIKVIENFKFGIVPDKDSLERLKVITGDKKMSADKELACKVEILRLLTNFFQIPFDIKKTLQMTKAVNGNTYYDAACVLVYIKDNNIKESYEVGDVMLFEGAVLFEDYNWVDYFKKLSNQIMDFIAKRREVDKKADVFSYLRNQENRFETSRDDENKISDEIVQSMNNLSNKVDSELKQMENDVDNAIKNSGEKITFKLEDAEGQQQNASGTNIEKPKKEPEDRNVGEVPQTNSPGKPGAIL